MEQRLEQDICRNLIEEKREIEYIESQVNLIRARLLDRVPDRFSKRDVINAFFGALTLGLTFILKGSTVTTAVGLSGGHMMAVIAATLLVLFGEIYFIGYSRVKNKTQRRFGQFMTKRLFCMYGITIFVGFGLVYLLNLNSSTHVHEFSDVMKIAVLVSFPCAVGSAIPSLLRKY